MIIGLDISVLNSPKKTGIAVYTHNLIKAILENDKKDQFILFGIATFDTYDYLKNIEFKNYPNVKLVIKKIPAKLFRTIFKLWQTLEWPSIDNLVGNIDIYHSFNWYFPPQKNGKKIATIFDMTPQLFPKYHHSRTVELEKIRFGRIKKMADLVITISENSKKDFLKFFPESKVEVVYPGVSDFNTKYTEGIEEQILKKYYLTKNYFLSVSTIEPRKNIKGLIKAYLRGKFNHDLVLVGVKGWGEEIETLIKGHERIKILGYIPDKELNVLYKNAFCFIYPSFYEGFGLPVLEAMNLGIPIICSNTSSLPEVGGDAPLYVNPNDEEGITKALIKISSDKRLLNILIERGYQQAKKFSWKKSAEKLIRLYHDL